MAITQVSSGYQGNFNPNIPYADFYNTEDFAKGLGANLSHEVNQAQRSHESNQKLIHSAVDPNSRTPVLLKV